METASTCFIIDVATATAAVFLQSCRNNDNFDPKVRTDHSCNDAELNTCKMALSPLNDRHRKPVAMPDVQK